MGNKNARRRASMAFTGGPAVGSSATAAQPGKANSDPLKDSTATMAPNALKRTGAPPKALSFRSYQTGTLNTKNFEPSSSISKAPLQSPTKKPLSATSPVFVPVQTNGKNVTTESPGIQRLKNLLATMPRSTGRPSDIQQGGMSAATPSMDGEATPSSSNGETAPSTNSETTLTTPVSKSATGTAITTPSVFGPIGSPLPTLSVGDLAHLFNKDASATEAGKAQKDVDITSPTPLNNTMRVYQVADPSGPSYLQGTDESSPERFNIVDALSNMSIKEQSAFWIGKVVEITVNLQGFDTIKYDDNKSTEQINKELGEMKMRAVEMMKALGPTFVEHSRAIVLNLQFPENPCQRAIQNSLANSRTAQSWTPSYQAIENIANALKDFTSLARLDIVLHIPDHVRTSFTIEQLNFALPFYDLPFTGWRLRWQRQYMRHPEDVRSWPLEYLDRERAKIIRHRDWVRCQKEKEIEKAVFVRKSTQPAVQNLS
jgi:hypothetical protein